MFLRQPAALGQTPSWSSGCQLGESLSVTNRETLACALDEILLFQRSHHPVHMHAGQAQEISDLGLGNLHVKAVLSNQAEWLKPVDQIDDEGGKACLSRCPAHGGKLVHEGDALTLDGQQETRHDPRVVIEKLTKSCQRHWDDHRIGERRQLLDGALHAHAGCTQCITNYHSHRIHNK